MKKKVLITMGDPAGIGPFIIVKSLLTLNLKKTDFTIIGDKKILKKIKGFFKIESYINLIDLKNTKNIKKGFPSKNSGKASFEYLKEAMRILKREKDFCLVTAPLSKEAVKLVKKDFTTGHTEFLARKFSVNNFAMMMVGRRLKLLFLSRHIPLREVSRKVNLKDIENSLRLLINALKDLFKIRIPKIALVSLNPHAGVDTFLDKEEELLVRAKENLKEKSVKFLGPYPSDTLFREALKGKFSAVVVFYHDQGMIPFKTFEFHYGVNLTIGLPFIRTSPSHGPAFDLVNKSSLIDYNPMKEAIRLALKLSHNKS